MKNNEIVRESELLTKEDKIKILNMIHGGWYILCYKLVFNLQLKILNDWNWFNQGIGSIKDQISFKFKIQIFF